MELLERTQRYLIDLERLLSIILVTFRTMPFTWFTVGITAFRVTFCLRIALIVTLPGPRNIPSANLITAIGGQLSFLIQIVGAHSRKPGRKGIENRSAGDWDRIPRRDPLFSATVALSFELPTESEARLQSGHDIRASPESSLISWDRLLMAPSSGRLQHWGYSNICLGS